jgi:hypothetical protein
MALPEELKSSYAILERAYPNKFDNLTYLTVLKLFDPYFSDRQLAVLISHFTNLHYIDVINDLYKVHHLDLDTQALWNYLLPYGVTGLLED